MAGFFAALATDIMDSKADAVLACEDMENLPAVLDGIKSKEYYIKVLCLQQSRDASHVLRVS